MKPIDEAKDRLMSAIGAAVDEYLAARLAAIRALLGEPSGGAPPVRAEKVKKSHKKGESKSLRCPKHTDVKQPGRCGLCSALNRGEPAVSAPPLDWNSRFRSRYESDAKFRVLPGAERIMDLIKQGISFNPKSVSTAINKAIDAGES